MVTFPMTLTDPLTLFHGHSIFEVEYLKKWCVIGKSYYRSLIGKRS